MIATPIASNEVLIIGGILGGSFIIIMTVAAIGGMLPYRKKILKLQANKNDSNL